MNSRLIYLHLTLAHAKGQGQGHIQFDCEYLENGEKGQTLLLPTNIKYCISSFDWHIYIWPWPILNDVVKVINTSTVNTLQVVADRANNTIANK